VRSKEIFMETRYKDCIRGRVFVEINAVLQKYLGRPSEPLVLSIREIIGIILEACDYTYSFILREENGVSDFDCSHIAGKKSIKQFDGQLLIELDNILQQYIGKFSKHIASSIMKIITIILDTHGYRQKPIK
jgi:hypothetical protein